MNHGAYGVELLLRSPVPAYESEPRLDLRLGLGLELGLEPGLEPGLRLRSPPSSTTSDLPPGG